MKRLSRPCSVFCVLSVLTGCTPPIRQFDLKNQSISCDEANRASYETLRGMKYSITSFEPATPGKPGVIRGVRSSQPVTIRIECNAAGANIDASEDGKLLGQIDFKRAFFISFGSVLSSTRARKEMDDRVAARAAPDSIQRNDLQVVLTPIDGAASKLDFGVDLSAAGILPLRVRISNLTARNYQLDPEAIRLTRDDRQRASALTPEAAARQILQARDPRSGEALTAASEGELITQLRGKLFVGRRLSSGQQLEGFLYFPLAKYLHARVVVSEDESGETEGFMIEF